MKRYKHDCKQCKLMGTFKEYDLYFCDSRIPTLIARYGDQPWDYHSHTLILSLATLSVFDWEAVALGMAVSNHYISINAEDLVSAHVEGIKVVTL